MAFFDRMSCSHGGIVNLFRGIRCLIALQSQLLIALIGMLLSNIADSCTEALVGPLILSATPGRMEGRVFSTFGTATTTCSLLATFLSGYLSSTLLHTVDIHLSVIDLNATNLLNSGAGLALIAGGLYAYRHLRKYPWSGMRPGCFET